MNDQPDPLANNTERPSAYRVLARKYRPTTFDDLIGQQPMVQTLTNAFDSGRIAQAYMLTGVRGVGKTTTARILARALNYQSDTIDAPHIALTELGDHCQAIMEGNHVDVVEMDAASHTGIGDIREIIASVRYKPVSARYKVYVIDEVHMLSTAAFNGLLKTLEEPPEHVKFIFATTEISKVPITVLSRCQRFDLRRIDSEGLMGNLQKIADLENVEVEKEALAMIARAAEGSVRDAQSLFDQAIAHASGQQSSKDSAKPLVDAVSTRNMLGLADRARIIDLFEQVMKGDITAALQELKSQYDTGAEPGTILTDLADFVHFVTRLRYVKEAAEDPALSPAEKTRGLEFAEKLSPRVLGRAWQILLKGIAEVNASARPLAASDMVLVRLTHAADLPTPDEAIRKMLASGDAETNTPPSASASTAAAPPDSSGNGFQAGRPEMAKISTGSVAQQMNIAASPITQPSTAPAAKSHLIINTFEELLEVAEQKREIMFKLALRNHVRLVHFEVGKIELNLIGNPPRNFLTDLAAKLREWTGQQWMIATSREEGAASVKENEEAKKQALVEDASLNPTVAAVLSTFAGAKIIDVRIRDNDIGDSVDDVPVNPDQSTDDDMNDYFDE